MRRLSNNGDTIIEVLISIVVVGAVLAGAFVTTNRSYKSIRQAQERAEALKIAESQVERLKSLDTIPVDLFCIPKTGIPTPDNETVSATNPTRPAGDPFPDLNSPGDTLTYVPECQFTNGGIPYNAAITRTAVGTTNTFTVYVRWDSISGNGHDQVVINYRL